jgi:hypothetical protein
VRALARAAATTVVALVPVVAGAQTWRNLDAARARRDSAPVDVRLEYVLGAVQARPAASDSVLYDMHLRYDAARVRPVVSFDTASRRLTLGTRTRDDAVRGPEGADGGEATVELTRGAPLDLSVRLSVATGAFDLGGLAVRRLALNSQAGESKIRFDTANMVTMTSLELDATAAAIHGSRLANANAERIRVSARAASTELDLGGVWTRDLEIDIDVFAGNVTIIVPMDVGVEVESRRLLASVEMPGLTRSGDLYVSPNLATAPRKVRIRANATLSKLRIAQNR